MTSRWNSTGKRKSLHHKSEASAGSLGVSVATENAWCASERPGTRAWSCAEVRCCPRAGPLLLLRLHSWDLPRPGPGSLPSQTSGGDCSQGCPPAHHCPVHHGPLCALRTGRSSQQKGCSLRWSDAVDAGLAHAARGWYLPVNTHGRSCLIFTSTETLRAGPCLTGRAKEEVQGECTAPAPPFAAAQPEVAEVADLQAGSGPASALQFPTETGAPAATGTAAALRSGRPAGATTGGLTLFFHKLFTEQK